MTRLSLFAAFLTVAVCPSARGQVPVESFESIHFEAIDQYTATSSTARIERLEVGNLTDSVSADVIQLRGGEVQVHVRPAESDYTHRVAVGIDDFVVIPEVGPGGLDALLTVGTSGAYLRSLQSENPTTTWAVSAVLGWDSVEQLQFDSTNGVVYGLVQPGNSLIRRMEVVNQALVPLSDLQVPAGALEVRSIDWDGEGTSEWVVRFAGSLEVHDLDESPPSPLLWSSYAFADTRFAVSRSEASGEPDLLAWTERLGPLGTWLRVRDAVVEDQTMWLGHQVVDAIYAYDRAWNTSLPLHEDLAFCDTAGDVWLFERRTSPVLPNNRFFIFDQGGIHPPGTWIASPVTSPSYAAAFAGGDIDGDGDGDEVVGFHDLGRVEVMLELFSIDRLDQAPGMFVEMHAGSALKFEVAIWDANFFFETETHVEVTVFRQELGSSVDPSPVFQKTLEIPALGMGENEYIHTLATGPGPEYDAIYHVRAQSVEKNGSIEQRRWPSFTGLVSSSSAGIAQIALTTEVLGYAGVRTVVVPNGPPIGTAVNTTGTSGSSTSRPLPPGHSPPP